MKSKTLFAELDFPPWKPKTDKVPHLTIETNMTCNFACASCYNINHETVKTPEQVFAEIDLGLSRRKADSITLMGGEPTLHPHICRIIEYIKKKGIFCQMLTNGFLIYNDTDDLFLQKLINSGLDRIMFHVDAGQKNYGNPLEALHVLFQKTKKYHLLTSISWTIYENEHGVLPKLVRQFMKYPQFDGILALLEKPVDLAIRSGYRSNAEPRMFDEYYSLREELQVYPSVFLPSSLSDENIKWLIYLYYINSATGKTFYISPKLTRIYQNVYKFVFNREIFGNPVTRWAFGITLMAAGFFEIVLNPKRFSNFYRLLQKSGGPKQIRMHYIAIQDGPEFTSGKNEVSICYHCPDATVRNGKITPVCLADRINPLPGSNEKIKSNPELAGIVYRHLNEI